MDRNKILMIAVIGLLFLNLGTLGFLITHKPNHVPPGEMPPPNGEGPKQLIIEKLHFDDTQQKQYEVLVNDHRKRTHELRDASSEMHNQLYSLLKSETIDKVRSDSIIQQIAENQKAIDNLNFDHFQKIKAICKRDQLKDFDKLTDELSDLFGHKGPPPQH
jgi:periplasmic protein CpxP/Spy